MEKTLKDFYKDMQAWINGNCVDSRFSRSAGLCYNLRNWRKTSYIQELRGEQKAAFVAAGLDGTYPFNDGEDNNYQREKLYGSIYRNQARLDWIKQHAKD